jgi:uncharacterized repeat protein (TIGR03803 family)
MPQGLGAEHNLRCQFLQKLACIAAMRASGQTGNLYGTTPNGGNGCGIVYELSPPTTAGEAWTDTVLHKFDRCSSNLEAPQRSELRGVSVAAD